MLTVTHRGPAGSVLPAGIPWDIKLDGQKALCVQSWPDFFADVPVGDRRGDPS